MDHTRYKADIDGLRAIAVLSVLLFHMDVTAFSGGYVGVDIFFVISGFLITRLIRDEALKSEQFSFAKFYLRRARRLLPSFFFTLAVCFVVAFFLFPPPQMEQFSGSLFYSVISLANFHFWRESGYFDSAAVYKPLLHIWSLSVEEQFYLVWPLVLVFLLLKTPRRTIPATLIFFFSISLGLNFVFADGQIYLLMKFFPAASEWFSEGPASIFYLMPFRVFEFAIGALLVWVIERQPKNKLMLEPLTLAGLAMIFYPIFSYTDTTLFPSYNALMPCLGTALLIYSGESRYSGSLLRTPLLVEIGKISYSLYLIHWPAIIFYKYYIYDFGALSAVEQVMISIAAILAARFMYIYVEQPFRKSTGEKKTVPSHVFLISHGITGILLIALAASAWTHDGWAWRMPNSLTLKEIDSVPSRWATLLRNACNIFDLESSRCHPDAPLQVLSLGDSHHYVGYNMFAEAFHSPKNINLITFGAVLDCDFRIIKGEKLKALGLGWKNQGRCKERATVLSDPEFNKKLDVLVISSQYMFVNGEELPIIKYLRSKNNDLKIVIVGPYIAVRPYECADIINRFGSSEFCKNEKFVSYFGDNMKKDRYYSEYMKYNPLYINTIDMLCDQGILENCLTEVNSIPMFYDGDHPTLEFSLLMGRRMLEEYSTELKKIGFTIAGK